MENKASILIASSNLACINLFVYLLQSEYTLCTVNSGYEAINMAMNIKPDLILLDTKTTDMSGYETMLALRYMNDTKKISVIIITDSVNDEDRALNMGAADCIQINSTQYLIKNKIRNLLRAT